MGVPKPGKFPIQLPIFIESEDLDVDVDVFITMHSP
jgi:hypothetical protein